MIQEHYTTMVVILTKSSYLLHPGVAFLQNIHHWLTINLFRPGNVEEVGLEAMEDDTEYPSTSQHKSLDPLSKEIEVTRKGSEGTDMLQTDGEDVIGESERKAVSGGNNFWTCDTVARSHKITPVIVVVVVS